MEHSIPGMVEQLGAAFGDYFCTLSYAESQEPIFLGVEDRLRFLGRAQIVISRMVLSAQMGIPFFVRLP